MKHEIKYKQRDKKTGKWVTKHRSIKESLRSFDSKFNQKEHEKHLK